MTRKYGQETFGVRAISVGDRVRCGCGDGVCSYGRPIAAHHMDGVLVIGAYGHGIQLESIGKYANEGWVVVPPPTPGPIFVGDHVRCGCAAGVRCPYKRPLVAHSMGGVLVVEHSAGLIGLERAGKYSPVGFVVVEPAPAPADSNARGGNEHAWAAQPEHELLLPSELTPPVGGLHYPTPLFEPSRWFQSRSAVDVVAAATGRELDDLLDSIGTSRIGSDSDEEAREQLLRHLWARYGAPTADFLTALTRAARRELPYPDSDRERSKRGHCRKKLTVMVRLGGDWYRKVPK